MKKKIFFYAINNTFSWWRFFSDSLSNEFETLVITEHKSSKLYSLKNRFYFYYKNQQISSFSKDEIDNIIDRCRVLRNIDKNKARKMVIAYEYVFEDLFKDNSYSNIISFPIDRYPMDVMNRVAKRYNIDHLEITVSVLKNFSMILKLGNVMSLPMSLSKTITKEATYDQLIDDNYQPNYVNKSKFNVFRWLYLYSYQNLRALAFKFIMLIEKDPLSLHYLDSQMYLSHKVRLKDIRVFKFINHDYLDIIKKKDKNNVIIALQLYPEASIDYWVRDMGIVDYENFLIHVLKSFSKLGYNVFLKDHPLQFGFRTTAFLEKASLIDNVFFLPYESDINYLMKFSKISFTTTGTIGLQASINGLVSFVTPSYYSNEKDFKVYSNKEEFDNHLKSINLDKMTKSDLENRRNRIVNHVHKTSFYGSILTFFKKSKFKEDNHLVSLINNMRIYLKNKQNEI
tara:strand:- start:8704 stop:10068 length:1365 start_codon:yes stop_codon:yes gene_type:complete